MKFNIGDSVITDEGLTGIITSTDDYNDFNPWYLVKFDNEREKFITEDCLEPYKRDEVTESFLTELQALLQKYDAMIGVVYCMCEDGKKYSRMDLVIEIDKRQKAVAYPDIPGTFINDYNIFKRYRQYI